MVKIKNKFHIYQIYLTRMIIIDNQISYKQKLPRVNSGEQKHRKPINYDF